MLNLSAGDHGLLRRLSLVLLASFAVVALAGCGIFSPDESDDGGGGNPTTDFVETRVGVVPDSEGRDNVIQNLETAYRLLNYEEYEKLIHADYVFRVDPAEIDIVGIGEYSAAEDLESTYAMFNGETGEEPVLDPVTGLPTGEFRTVPPVQQIELELIPDSASSWTLMEDGEFAGSWRRVYDVDMTVTYSGDGRIDTIRGKQVFYVRPGTLSDDTSGTEYWQLRAWEDQGINS
jgi:hypothetical protein